MKIAGVEEEIARLAAGDELGASGATDFQVGEIGLELGRIDDRAHFRIGRLPVSRLPRCGLGGERVDEAVVRGARHDHPARRRTGLPGEPEAPLRSYARGDGRIGVFEHDDGVLAAHLELHAGEPTAADRVDAETGCDRAGEADGGHSWVAHDRIADGAPGTVHDVEHSGR